MTWWKRGLPAIAFAWVLAVPAAAQVGGRPIELSGGAGIFSYDTRSSLQDGPVYNAAAGWRLAPWVTFEASGTFGRADADTVPEHRASLTDLSGDFRFNLRPAEDRVVPFFLAGFGLGRSRATAGVPEILERGTPSLGAGALFNLLGQPRWYVRVQVRDVMFKERRSLEYSHHVAAHVGLQLVLRGKFKDQDLDGVRDWIDHCPDTPIGATVDAAGCPHDADQDSVVDGIDKCPDTPHGCKVDPTGCPIDSDGDGVCDGIDTCATTPKGAKVDPMGCPIDSDGDGVFDGLDQCPDTPKGAKIDDKGCPIDSDGDGVPDGLDQCPDTPKGAQVDAKGCETEASQLEGEMLDTGRIRLRGVNFETGKAVLLPDGLKALDAAGEVLSKWSDLKVEIGGHTDAKGKPAANLKLSRARADTVRAYLLRKFPTIQPSQLVAKGYGSGKPLASNDTEAGRALNRRVELVVLNKGVLVKSGGQRRTGGK